MSEQPVSPDGVKTPAEVHAETLADPATPAVQAEVLEEVGPQPVKMVATKMGNGVEIQVPMQSTWRKSAMDYMMTGQFDSWAESVLSDEDLGLWDEWMDTDPSMGELQEFIYEVGKATGEAAGQNRALRRSLERSRRR